MWIRTRLLLRYCFAAETVLLLKVRPRSGWHQWVARESSSIQPDAFPVQLVDEFGNLCQRVVAPAGPWRFSQEAEVRVGGTLDAPGEAPFVPVQELPDAVLPYLAPSRYCESDRLIDAARDCVGEAPPGSRQVHAILEDLRRRIRYQPGSSGAPRSALEVNTGAEGVCSDLAHVAIALCRALSIPARYVSGYRLGLDPPDMHAWFEAYIGGRWYTFDPIEAVPHPGRVVADYGRDAADAAFVTQYGPPAAPERVQVEAEERA